jgi:hypothetical protein
MYRLSAATQSNISGLALLRDNLDLSVLFLVGGLEGNSPTPSKDSFKDFMIPSTSSCWEREVIKHHGGVNPNSLEVEGAGVDRYCFSRFHLDGDVVSMSLSCSCHLRDCSAHLRDCSATSRGSIVLNASECGVLVFVGTSSESSSS